MRRLTLIIKYHKTLLWSLIMSYLLFSPASGIPTIKWFSFHNFDKIIHLGMFAILTFLFFNERIRKSKPVLKIILAFFIFLLLGSSMSEVIQHYFIPGRTGNLYDLLADIIGFFIGLPLYFLFRKIFIITKN